MKEVRLSRKGRVASINGRKVHFENFLKVFGDYNKAVYEYALYVWMLSSNDRATEEIFKLLLGGET